MAYGVHWEVRGFGIISRQSREAVERLEPQFDAPSTVTDDYLWVPAAQINLKLRSTGPGSLKFKRLKRRDSASKLELWEERANEDYGFPLSAETVTAMFQILGVSTSAAPRGADSRDEILSLLRGADKRIRVVTVTKTRRARVYPTHAGNIIVEVADIGSPEIIASIGLEDESGLGSDSDVKSIDAARDRVAAVANELRLDSDMRILSYLDAVALWANNKQIGVPRS